MSLKLPGSCTFEMPSCLDRSRLISGGRRERTEPLTCLLKLPYSYAFELPSRFRNERVARLRPLAESRMTVLVNIEACRLVFQTFQVVGRSNYYLNFEINGLQGYSRLARSRVIASVNTEACPLVFQSFLVVVYSNYLSRFRKRTACNAYVA